MDTNHLPLVKFNELPCCPELDVEPCCDVIDMRRRLLFPTKVRDKREQPVAVEVIIHTRFSRCSGPLGLGDLVYTTTLLPGEKVRLATSDRRSRFSVDSESKLSYRSEQMSEEQYRMSSLRAFMADQNSKDNGSSRSTESGSWDFHGDASGSIGFLSASADANAKGSHNAESTNDYLRQHSSHASMADRMSVEATRKAHSISIGEVSNRSHTEGESQDHAESSSRSFENKNQCHALTFLFYRINKTETITFEVVSIERRVIDDAAPTPVLANPVRPNGGLAVVTQDLAATSKLLTVPTSRGVVVLAQQPNVGVAAGIAVPIGGALRAAALAEVDKALADQGLLDEKGEVSPKVQERFGFERKTCIPTAGVIVKGCLDECVVCEPELHESIKLDLVRKSLENDLLKRQIELLDRAQDYRCCPAGEEEAAPVG